MNSTKISKSRDSIKTLVEMSLVFHNLNKTVEQSLGISLVQYHCLNTLREMPGCSPLALSRSVGMHPSTLTQGIKRLARKKFIFVGEDPKDLRRKIISLNLKGHRALIFFESQIDFVLEKENNNERSLHIRPNLNVMRAKRANGEK